MGEVVTVFRSRLRADANPEYAGVAAEMSERARAMPGYVDHKVFTADDGERVTVVTFASLEDHERWAKDVEHRAAQQRGREAFYETYSIQVGEVLRSHRWPAR
jgi:heme-degrading monooxygenase HmoA